MDSKKNELWEVDRQLFDRMETEAISPNETNFFRNMRFKQECEITACNDLILSADSNTDKLFIVRIIYDEYEVGILSQPRLHVMNLSEALNLNLKENGLLDRDITLLQWLRERDYQGVLYDHNYDYM